jgi:hypothetical protein
MSGVSGPHALVFRAPIAGWSMVKARLDPVMQIAPWRLHDVRRSFVTGMADLGIRPDVIELCVNRTSGLRSGVAGIATKASSCQNAKPRWRDGRHPSQARARRQRAGVCLLPRGAVPSGQRSAARNPPATR